MFRFKITVGSQEYISIPYENKETLLTECKEMVSKDQFHLKMDNGMIFLVRGKLLKSAMFEVIES